MNATHTPGPWQVYEPDDLIFIQPVDAKNNAFIARCYGLPLSISEAQANARLIAAAPEGYALGQEVIAWAEALERNVSLTAQEAKLLKMARAFIAKAEGQ